MIIKYQVASVEDTGQRRIIKSFNSVIEAIEFRETLTNGEFRYYTIEVCYFKE